jgi:hypothetical protein
MRLQINNLTFEHNDPAVVYATALRDAFAFTAWDDSETPIISTVDFERQRAWALAEVQRLRAEQHAAVDDQPAVHADKLAQATAYLADAKADAKVYPALSGAEAAERKLAAVEMAALITAQAAETRTARDAIEARAYKARTVCETAKTIADLVSALVLMAGDG